MTHRQTADDATQETTGPVVRRMTAGDIDAVHGVARAMWGAAYKDIIPEAERDDLVRRAYSAETLKRRMETGIFLVAVWRDEVVGFADFESRSEERGDVALMALYVLPAMQGRGLGTRLLERGMDAFPSARSLVLRVLRRNAAGRRFYEARGFRYLGEHRWRLSSGEVVVELEMVLEIGGRG
jgi:GNAT superfamily N-acetyltransferase